MKEFQNIGKRMPYAESDEYLSQLLSRATEKAISQPTATTKRTTRTWLAAAAIATLLAVAGISYFQHQPTTGQLSASLEESPIEQFLNELSDDDVQLLACYDIEEIPEY